MLREISNPQLLSISLQTRRKCINILMVEGSDKGSIEGKHDLLGNPIALVLEVLDLPLIRCKVGHVGKSPF